MATYKNYSIGGVMQTKVSEMAGGQSFRPWQEITPVDITVWGIGRSAGCAENHGIATRQGVEVTMSR